MINKTLSELAEDFSKGDIDATTYRKNRGALLQGIVAGQIPVHPIDYLPPIEVEEEAAVTQPMARETTQILGESVPRGNLSGSISEPTVTAEDKPFPALFIAVSTGIVILLIIAVVMFYPEPPAVTSKQTDTAVTAIDPELSKPGESLITRFLEQNTWNKQSLDGFQQEWSQLTFDQINAVSSTKRMQRFSSAIYKQFMEAKALASIDSEQAIAKQQMLLDFTRQIGIYDSRMTIE